jgi:hypothetical protein
MKANSATPAAVAHALAPAVDDDEGAVDLINDRDDLKAKPILESVLPKENNKTVRFALVKGFKAFVKSTHFLAGVNGKGCTVICPGSECIECKKGGEHSNRRKIAALAIKYETDNSGKFAAGTTKPSMSIGFVNLSPTAYGVMSECPSADEGEDVYSIDYKVVKKSNGIGWDFFRMSSPPAYVKAQMEADVAELAAPYADGKVLKSRLGKVVSAIELKVMLLGASADATPTLDDLESIL